MINLRTAVQLVQGIFGLTMVLNRPPTSAHSAQFGEGFSLPGLPFRVSARRGPHTAGRLLLAQPAHQGHRSGCRSNPALRPHRGLLAAPKQAISCVCRGPAESAVARTSAPDPRRHRAPRGPTNTLGRRAHATPVRLAPHAPRCRTSGRARWVGVGRSLGSPKMSFFEE